MERLELRLDFFPLILTVIPPVVDEADLVDYFPRFEAAIFGPKVPVVHVMDAMRMTTPPGAGVRRTIADWRKAVVSRGLARYQLGSAIATPSSLVRGSLTAVGWLFPNPLPNTWVADLPSAAAWVIERFEKSELAVPAPLRAYQAHVTR